MSSDSLRFLVLKFPIRCLIFAGLVFVPAAALPTTGLASEEWAGWRGSNAQGVAAASVKNLPVSWSETENVKWKTQLPGRGWSSPVVRDGKVWVTAALETKASKAEIEERLKENTGGQPLTVLSEVTFLALRIDAFSGEIDRKVTLFTVKQPQWVHSLNSYASPTPVIDQGRLYCHFGTFGTVCLDTVSGDILWKNDELPLMHENGPGSSPILWRDKLIFHGDGSDVQFIAALHKQTGKVAWKVKRSGKMHDNPQLKKGYGTPAIATVAGKEQLVSPAANWLYGYDPESGRELWKLDYETLGFSNVPPPIIGDGMLFVCTCFMKSELLGIRHDGSAAPEIVWRHRRNVPTTPAPVLVGNEIYFTSDQGGVVSCLDAKSGESIYRERIASGNYSASPVFADGKLYFFSREGKFSVLKAGREFEVLGSGEIDGKIFASPAMINGAILLRSDSALYRIERQ